MELGSWNDCDCYDVEDCLILRSSIEIPAVIDLRNRPGLKVLTFGGQEFSLAYPETIGYIKYSSVNSKRPFYFIQGSRLYILNNRQLKAVIVRGIFDDPLYLQEYSGCNVSGQPTPDPCFDAREEDFPIRGSLVDPMYAMVLEKLSLPLQIEEKPVQESATL